MTSKWIIYLNNQQFPCVYLFKYRVEDDSVVHAKLLENRYPHSVYNWIAPEILAGYPPTESSDLYSLVSIIWEIQNG